MATFQSLASEKTYLLAQVRRKNNRAHFQVISPNSVNRDYGYTFDISLHGENGGAMATLEELAYQPVASLAKTEKVYIPVQVTAEGYEAGVLHIQTCGPSVNRPYGVAVNFRDVPSAVLETIESLK